MSNYLFLLIGFTAGCIWMGISFFTAYWWCNAINKQEDRETGTEDTFDRVRREYGRD